MIACWIPRVNQAIPCQRQVQQDMAFHYPSLISRDKDAPHSQSVEQSPIERDNASQKLRLQTDRRESSNIAVSTKPRFGYVKEKIWNYQNREVRNEWNRGHIGGKISNKDVSYDGELKHNRKYEFSKQVAAAKSKGSKEGTAKDKDYKGTMSKKQSRMIIDKIWGHKKREVKRELSQESTILQSGKNYSNLVGSFAKPRASQAQVSYSSQDLHVWELYGKKISKQPNSSFQTGRNNDDGVSLFASNIPATVRQRAEETNRRIHLGRLQDEPNVKVRSDRVTDLNYDRFLLNGHSQSTRTSERISPSNLHNSQSISDRHQNDSLEDDFHIRPTVRLRSEERDLAHRRQLHGYPEPKHFLLGSHDENISYKHAHKDYCNSKTISSHYQPSVPGSTSYGELTSPPSYRRYRRVNTNKDVRESKAYREHKRSHVTSSSSRHVCMKGDNVHVHRRHRKNQHSSKGENIFYLFFVHFLSLS